jgi:lipoyl(octanoyl) transferase
VELPASDPKIVEVYNLGAVDYFAAWELQKQCRADVLAKKRNSGALILCEHSPGVITLGRGTQRTSIRGTPNLQGPGGLINELDIEIIETERGGEATYHGPGQITCYPILDLTLWRRDVGWYLRSLETVIINVLAEFGIDAVSIAGHTGVWVATVSQGFKTQEHSVTDQCTQKSADSSADVIVQLKSPPAGYAKIASLGVRLSRWISMHGLALNYGDCLRGFAYIHPCGYQSLPVTSIASILEARQPGHSAPEYTELSQHLIAAFSRVFECEVQNS